MPPNLRNAEPDMILRPDKMNNEEEGNKRSVGTRNIVGLMVYTTNTTSRSDYLRPPCANSSAS